MLIKISRLIIFTCLLHLFIQAGSAPVRRILINGKIISGSPAETNEAIVIDGGKIIFVGSSKIASRFNIANRTVITDLKGKIVIPGFHDGHQNFLLGAALLGNRLNFYALDLESIIHRLKNKKKNVTEGALIGYNFEHLLLKNKKWPNRYDLDKVSGNSPVIVFSSDGSIAWVNSFALKLFGIDKKTLPIAGGRIIRFEDNNPSGILIGKAMDLLKGYSFHECIQKIRPDKEKIIKAMAYVNRFGITSVTSYGDLEFVRQLEELESQKLLTLRFNIVLSSNNIGKYLINKVGFSSDSSHIRIVSVSKNIDGTLYSSSAAMFSEYRENHGNYGFLTTNINDISDLLSLYKRNGIIASFNAEGDRGVHLVLNSITAATRKSSENNHRYRISNFHFIIDEDISRLKKLNVMPVMRPAFFIEWDSLIERLIGQRKAGNALRVGTLQNKGIKIAFGSGWPGESVDPFKGIGFAVFRKIKKNRSKEDRWFIEEKISLTDAIRAYTYNPSYSVSDEERTGSLEKGKFADMAIIQTNIFSDSLSEKSISSVMKIYETIAGGDTVFKEEN